MDINFQKKTKRLVLRPYALSDYDIWKETFLNLGKSKNKWDTGAKTLDVLTKSKFKVILATQKKNRNKDSNYDLVAFDKKTGAIIGFASLMDVSRGLFQNAYLGYKIINTYWGEGYGKEMVQGILKIGFTDLKIHRIEAGIDPRNKGSIALAKAVGFRREGLSKRRLFLDNEWLDFNIYAMTCEDLGIKWNTK